MNHIISRRVFVMLEQMISNIPQPKVENINVSLMYGIAGDILTYYELYEWSGNKQYEEKCHELIDCLVENLNNSESINLGTGIIGVLYVLSYLNRKNILDADDFEFNQYDILIDKHIDICVVTKNYDLMCGLVGVGLYYMERSLMNDACKVYVWKIIGILCDMSESYNETVYWKYHLEETTNDQTVNLGLLHGMPSMLYFLLIAHQSGYQHHNMILKIRGGLNFIINSRVHKTYYSFPRFTSPNNKTDDKSSRLGYCYGDFGIINLFIKAYDTTGDDDYLSIATGVYKNLYDQLLTLQSSENDNIFFCHGLSSVFYFTNRFKDISCDSRQIIDNISMQLMQSITSQLGAISSRGLLTGYNGIILALLSYYKQIDSSRLLLLM